MGSNVRRVSTLIRCVPRAWLSKKAHYQPLFARVLLFGALAATRAQDAMVGNIDTTVRQDPAACGVHLARGAVYADRGGAAASAAAPGQQQAPPLFARSADARDALLLCLVLSFLLFICGCLRLRHSQWRSFRCHPSATLRLRGGGWRGPPASFHASLRLHGGGRSHLNPLAAPFAPAVPILPARSAEWWDALPAEDFVSGVLAQEGVSSNTVPSERRGVPRVSSYQSARGAAPSPNPKSLSRYPFYKTPKPPPPI